MEIATSLWENLLSKTIKATPDFIRYLPVLADIDGKLRETFILNTRCHPDPEIGIAVPSREAFAYVPTIEYLPIARVQPCLALTMPTTSFLGAFWWSLSFLESNKDKLLFPIQEMRQWVTAFDKGIDKDFSKDILEDDVYAVLSQHLLYPLRHSKAASLWVGAAGTTDGRAKPVLFLKDERSAAPTLDPKEEYLLIVPLVPALNDDELSLLISGGDMLWPAGGEDWAPEINQTWLALDQLNRMDLFLAELGLSDNQRGGASVIQLFIRASLSLVRSWRELYLEGVERPNSRQFYLPPETWGFQENPQP